MHWLPSPATLTIANTVLHLSTLSWESDLLKGEIQESLDSCALVACSSPIAQRTSDTWLFDLPPATKKNWAVI